MRDVPDFAKCTDEALLQWLQILMVAKFDSGRSDILVNHPTILAGLEELIAIMASRETQPAILSEIVGSRPPKSVLDLVSATLYQTTSVSAEPIVNEDEIRQMVFPYSASQTEIERMFLAASKR